MQVKKLEEFIQSYKSFLQKDKTLAELYKWESLHHFQTHWDIDAPDFAKMYDASLQNNTSRRLWKRASWFPKEMMLKLIAVDPEFVRRMFQSLFDESKEVIDRISRFKFGCDELLLDYKKQYPLAIDNNHYHDDNEMVLLYLSFQYPQKYTLLSYFPFIKTLEKLGSKAIPGPYDTERFLKITNNILYRFLQKDEELIEIHQKRLASHLSNISVGQIIVHDFYCACAEGQF